MRFAGRQALGTTGTRLMLALAGLALLGQLGRWSDRFDAINLFLPYLILLTGAAGAVALAARMPRPPIARFVVTVALLLFVAGAIRMLLDEQSAPNRARCTGGGIRIVQLNLWKKNRSASAVAGWIESTGADLVTLEEARNAPDLLTRLQTRFPYRQSCVGPTACSTVILSRYRPVASGGLAAGDPENRGALSAAWMRFSTDDGPFTAVVAHLGRPWPFKRHEGDRTELVKFVRTLPSTTTIVAGDFNLPGWTYQLDRLETALGLERRTNAILSWPAVVAGRRTPAPFLGIDHLFAGRGWSVDRVQRGPFVGSDHYPLVVDLRRCSGSGADSARNSSNGGSGGG